MPYPWFKLLILCFAVTALDRITKHFIMSSMTPGNSISVLGDFFRIGYVQNSGGAFGTNLGGNLFYILAALFAAGILVIWLVQKRHMPIGLLGIALMLGGAIGNLWDRITIKAVIDFLDFGIGRTRWPTFNIADTAITTGIILLILQEFLSPRDESSDVAVDGTCEKDSEA